MFFVHGSISVIKKHSNIWGGGVKGMVEKILFDLYFQRIGKGVCIDEMRGEGVSANTHS